MFACFICFEVGRNVWTFLLPAEKDVAQTPLKCLGLTLKFSWQTWCACVCVRACMRACLRVCVRACVCVCVWLGLCGWRNECGNNRHVRSRGRGYTFRSPVAAGAMTEVEITRAWDWSVRTLRRRSIHFSPLSDRVVGGTWGTIQQRSSFSLFCERPLWAVPTWGRDVQSFSAVHRFLKLMLSR